MNATSTLAEPALIVAAALAVGMAAQVAARHLRIPGIVLLLAAGVLLGPDVADLLRPHELGSGLDLLVGFAVSIILFEGALNLDLRELRRRARSIRKLVTLGAAITTVGGALAARWILGWSWSLSLLFGTLVIVTGPTVIQPLLRRIRVRRRLATVLEAEGVFGDAVGAIAAVVALEVVIAPAAGPFQHALVSFLTRVGVGVLIGLAGGALCVLLLRYEHLVPHDLENVTVLSLVVAMYQVANSLREESGIVAVIVAGLALANLETERLEDLRDFKEQLTVMLLGLLFVLLAADVRIADVRGLGWAGVLTVATLMFVVRPVNAWASTLNTSLSPPERGFIAWLAPRGIVAAAVSSLFAQSLGEAGIAGGESLRALVFLVIGATVVVQGLTGSLVAGALGVKVEGPSGYVILGANSLARTLAKVLLDGGSDSVLVDSNPRACAEAESQGLRVIYGSALSESVLLRAGIERRAGAVALTTNVGINYGFARRARREYRVPAVFVALEKGDLAATPEMVRQLGARTLFGAPGKLPYWIGLLERDEAQIEFFRQMAPGADDSEEAATDLSSLEASALPVAVRRGSKSEPYSDGVRFQPGDELALLMHAERRPEALDWLHRNAFQEVPALPSADDVEADTIATADPGRG